MSDILNGGTILYCDLFKFALRKVFVVTVKSGIFFKVQLLLMRATSTPPVVFVWTGMINGEKAVKEKKCICNSEVATLLKLV